MTLEIPLKNSLRYTVGTKYQITVVITVVNKEGLRLSVNGISNILRTVSGYTHKKAEE